MKRNFTCKRCKKETAKSSHRDFKRGDIKRAKNFKICNSCDYELIEKKKKSRERKNLKKMREVFSSEIERYGEDCMMCKGSVISPYREWDKLPSKEIVFNSYCDAPNTSVCCWCRDIKNTDGKIIYFMPSRISMIYLVYSSELNRYKIGETKNFINRIKGIKSSQSGNGRYRASDWELISNIPMPNSSKNEREEIERRKLFLFREYRETGEYFKIGIPKDEVIRIFKENR